MLSLDLRSLAVMAGLMGAVLGLLLLGVRRNHPAATPGSLAWAWAPLTCAASVLFYALEPLLPQLLVVVAGNGLLLGGLALFLIGTRRFYGLPTRWKPVLLGLALSLLALALFLQVWPDYRVRVWIFTLSAAVLLLAHVRVLARQERSFGSRFTAMVLLAMALIMAVRAASGLWVDGPDSGRFDPSLAQALYISAFNFALLLASVGVLLMASERLREEFRHIARHDDLTGALTRRAWMELAVLELERARRYGHALSLMIFDLDHFKRINDQHGHLTGDRVLREVVALARTGLRQSDQIGRFGGEEFVVLLPETGADAAAAVAERVRAAVAGRQGEPAASLSGGLISLPAGTQPAPTLDELLARADAALYRAKQEGRDRIARAALT
ncbi:GGDEF domain-containing protein [Pelomonas sp. CA6]|uniref:GGDEF domain-containing protein n=1 Tax=Pelomonas sp. CA6 TaxID=2907999 RepID=UPI001F4C0483|nr:GGDEF domain-containing protein [Pelomonas sp. CA6]MCH7343384.1 GGDEF domain-containing protein [Pelomonas sp. CA6]